MELGFVLNDPDSDQEQTIAPRSDTRALSKLTVLSEGHTDKVICRDHLASKT